MKILYFDCPMGAAGDMLMSALLGLHPDPNGFIDRMNNMGLKGVKFRCENVKSRGICGIHTDVSVRGVSESDGLSPIHRHSEAGPEHHPSENHEHSEHRHEHRSLGDIYGIIDGLKVPQKVAEDAKKIYRIVAEAESAVHGEKVSEIHFHEVGSLDAIADMVGVCSLIYDIAPDIIKSSPICVGFGTVRAAHGILPVPAPATALILKDIPIYGGTVQGELCTPTGAALLKYFASDFVAMPPIKIQKIGYGMGTKEFAEAPNCVRALLGESEDRAFGDVWELCCNLDDMTAEDISYAIDKLFEGGALDVFTSPAGMKKNRPGVLLSCLCGEGEREKMVRLIFKHTSTIGIREYKCRRYTLDRYEETIPSEYGSVRRKVSSGYGITKAKWDHDDMAEIADEYGISISDVREKLSDEGSSD